MAEELNFYQDIATIQQELKVKKTQYNKFGDYWYRNAEGILIAVKPFLKKYSLLMDIIDEMVFIGERHYLKTTVTITSIDKPSLTFKSTGYARECLTKPKMSEEQATGSASTFSHKYALQNMFLLDDSMGEPDSQDNSIQPPKKITTTQINELNAIIPKIVGGCQEDQLNKVNGICEHYNTLTDREIRSFADLTQDVYPSLIKSLKSQIK